MGSTAMASQRCSDEFARSSSSKRFGVPPIGTAKSFLLASKRTTVCSFLVVKRSIRYLPVASLAILAALVAILLPSIARIVLPLVHFGFVVLMPEMWNGAIRWLTPSCLFLLLNCIIITLAVTSGILSNSSRGSEFYGDHVVRMESHQQSEYVELPLKERQRQQQQVPCLPVKEHSSVKRRQIREQQIVPCMPIEEQALDGRVFKENTAETTTADRHFIRSASDMTIYDSGTSGKNHIRRSETISSSKASYEERSPSASSLIVVEVPPVDKLSDEDLKRRIDDFIAKFNAQIRRESRSSYED